MGKIKVDGVKYKYIASDPLNIQDIFATQRCLKRKEQIDSLMKSINDGERIEPILLFQDDNGRVSVLDGHHRLSAYYLAGRTILETWEFTLIKGAYNKKPLIFKHVRLMQEHGLVV